MLRCAALTMSLAQRQPHRCIKRCSDAPCTILRIERSLRTGMRCNRWSHESLPHPSAACTNRNIAHSRDEIRPELSANTVCRSYNLSVKKKDRSYLLYLALIAMAMAGRTMMKSADAPSASTPSAVVSNAPAYSAAANSAGDDVSADADRVDATDYANTEITFSASDGTAIAIPRYNGSSAAYTVSATPFFSAEDLGSTDVYFAVSELDDLGRAGVANAVLGPESMQTHERGSISDIHPSGWWEAKQSAVNVNRSHLIGNNLAGDQTDCAEAMITGSRQLNAGSASVPGSMLEYENQVADYMEATGNHVRYRVTPIFEGRDVTPHGVLMEAESIEDDGAGVEFAVYIYNVQPGWVCDYDTGEWELITEPEVITASPEP